MSPSWKTVGLVFGVAVLSIALAATLIWRPGDRPATSLHPQEDRFESSAEASAVSQLPDPSYRSEDVLTGLDLSVGASLKPSTDSSAAALAGAEACLRPGLDDRTIDEVELRGIWNCLRSLEWSEVAAPELAAWLCSAKRHPRQVTRIFAAAIYARAPADALTYLSEFRPPCIEIGETSLQLMAVETIGHLDQAWVAELENSMTADALFTGDSSEQGLLLAEYFIRRGNSVIATLLEKGGRGEFGGSDGEVSRAARVSLFVSSTMQFDSSRAHNAFLYAESLLYSSTTPAVVGGVLASFLSSKQTWPEGDSTPALQTLFLTLDDPKFTDTAAGILFFTQTSEGPPGCNKALWNEIWEKVLVVAGIKGWKPLK